MPSVESSTRRAPAHWRISRTHAQNTKTAVVSGISRAEPCGSRSRDVFPWITPRQYVSSLLLNPLRGWKCHTLFLKSPHARSAESFYIQKVPTISRISPDHCQSANLRGELSTLSTSIIRFRQYGYSIPVTKFGGEILRSSSSVTRQISSK